ncbi:hypothetical protein COCSADRAFT_236915 [Bipolaris sorokiniana ND90Pr]|uniref:Uncharacterized protein n=1 Tax=Cochliobolus sativus (strain ND90Pr / ATCC 201652) TaxID=665912 RepID=M2SVL9_COCSN|nr:uncharacterized protein COCSADRAFT_236915 [Bipolaris sorokiniana ND90Pr]EMD60882.1 hypothetical protein COCSADRAFT_236915 [Bipolaris sorokiniana ND90Pr]
MDACLTASLTPFLPTYFPYPRVCAPHGLMSNSDLFVRSSHHIVPPCLIVITGGGGVLDHPQRTDTFVSISRPFDATITLFIRMQKKSQGVYDTTTSFHRSRLGFLGNDGPYRHEKERERDFPYLGDRRPFRFRYVMRSILSSRLIELESV